MIKKKNKKKMGGDQSEKVIQRTLYTQTNLVWTWRKHFGGLKPSLCTYKCYGVCMISKMKKKKCI